VKQTLEQQKSEQACEILKELDLDCWLVWVRETAEMPDPVLKLILGSDLVWQSALLYSKTGERTAIVGSLDAAGLDSLKLFDRITPYTKTIREALRGELDHQRPKRIAINWSRDNVSADGLTVGMRTLLDEYLNGTPYANRFVSAESLISRLRGRKTGEEISRIQQAVDITQQILADAATFVRVGQTEMEVYQHFRERMQALGVTDAWQASHNPAVDAGPNKPFGHAGPTNNRTKAGQLLHFDFGVRYQGYCADLQRMFFFGPSQAIPAEVREAFNTVRDAIIAASRVIKPGLQGHEVDTVARTYVQEHGYQEYPHALGHQIGQSAHDGGTILGPLWDRYGSIPKGIVEAGNVFTLELEVPTKNYGEVSLEEDILITKTGCRFLSRRQQDLICIG
jgi:Xaa-Pro aminopeptidase